MATIHRFEDLEVWKLACALEQKIFTLAKPEIFKNDFDLIRQMNRATGAAMDNIAEGFGRGGRFEFINSLSIAKGEANEVQSQLTRALNRGYIMSDIYHQLKAEAEVLIAKLGSFMHYLNTNDRKGQKFQGRISNYPQSQSQTPNP